MRTVCSARAYRRSASVLTRFNTSALQYTVKGLTSVVSTCLTPPNSHRYLGSERTHWPILLEGEGASGMVNRLT